MAVVKVQVTKDYRLFTRSEENRPVCPKKHKSLLRSMQSYGFLQCYPVVCVRNKSKHLVVLDGQHRLWAAETIGLPVYFCVIEEAFDIAQVNGTQEKWNTRNFAETYAAQNKQAYTDGLEFADRFGLPVGTAFGMLAGTASWNNIRNAYISGQFKITDRRWADTVGTIYSQLVNAAPRVRNARLIEACMAVARVPGFDPQRLVSNIDRCREKLVSYSTRDAYLEMLEEVYNFGKQKLMGLRVEAIQAMRDRNAANSSATKKSKQVA